MTRNKSPASGQCGEVPCAGRCPALRERPVSVGGLVCAGLRSHLHEEAGAERAADVDVVVPAGELGAAPREAEAVHDARQLLPHVVRRHQRAVVDKVVVAPLVGLMVWLEETWLINTCFALSCALGAWRGSQDLWAGNALPTPMSCSSFRALWGGLRLTTQSPGSIRVIHF